MSTGTSPASEPSSVRTAYAFLRPLPSIRADEEAAAVPAPVLRNRWDRLFPSTTGVQDAGSSLNVTGLQLGDYVIQSRIGRGGMGAVFRANDMRLDRVVALKILAPEYTRDPGCVQRFQNEARAAAKLDHENIARVFASGEDGGQQYIAFEYVSGTNIRDMIQQRGALTSAETVNYILQMAEALRHTSAAGVVHRDIKPSNIIITPSGRAKLVDLGLARHRTAGEDDLTVQGTTLGTFDYISPEQALDPRNVDVRSDLYSLGCTAYHMLTGEPPYSRGSMFQKVLDHHKTEAPDASAKNPLVPQALSHIIRQMMDSQVENRYQRPEDLIRDLLPLATALGVPSNTGLWAEVPQARFSWAEHRGWILAMSLLAVIGVVASLPPREVAPPASSAVAIVPSVGQLNPPGEAPFIRTAPEVAIIGPSRAVEPTTTRNDGTQPSISPPQPPRGIKSGTLIGATLGPALLVPDPPETSFLTPRVSDSGNLPMLPQPPTDEHRFWVITTGVDGASGLPKSYPTLEAACLEAPDNATIELRFDGDSSSQFPIRIEGKSLRIRAQAGRRPVLRFDAPETVGLPVTSQMISVVNGSLEVFDVDIVFRVPRGRSVDRWSMFSLEYAKQVTLRGVSVTLDNPLQQQPGTLFELKTPSGTLRERMMPESMMPGPVQIQISESVFRGEADGFRLTEARDARIDITHSAWALSGTLLAIDTRNSVQMSTSVEPPPCQWKLDHVTAVLDQSLIRVEAGEAGVAPTVDVRCDNSLFSLLRPEQPMISMTGPVEMEEWLDRLVWKGGSNSMDVPGPWWEITAVRSLNAPNRIFNASDWSQHWNSSGNTPIDRNVFESIDAWDKPAFHAVDSTAFHLFSESNGFFKAPEAADGRNVGVDWTLPRLPTRLPVVEPVPSKTAEL
jgi:eukaryotic-like serine/threonine-protein kinase